jgi:hypothetical protein
VLASEQKKIINLGGGMATQTVADSAALVVERIALLDDSTKAKVVNYDGKIVPW